MKRLTSALACLALTACMSPSAAPLPAGAVSFAQVLQDNASTPYECTDYNPATRTCAAVGRYVQQADGTLLSEGLFLLNDQPRALARGVAPVRVIGGRACTQASSLQFELLEGANDPTAQFALGFMEELMAGAGEVCATYTPSGDGYSVSSQAQSGPLRGPIPSTSRFFASAPALRSEL